MHTVFIHGKIRRGFGQQKMMSNETFLGNAETAEQYALFLMDNKVLVTKRPASTIKGEAYAVGDDTLSALDRLEGHPHVSKRELVRVRLADGTMADAWLYFYLQPLRSSTLVESGDYGESVQGKQ